MATQKRKACSSAERRKKLAIFASLCAFAVVVIALVVVLLTLFKSENDKEEKQTFGKLLDIETRISSFQRQKN